MDYQEIRTFKACDKIRKYVIEGLVKSCVQAEENRFVITKMINLRKAINDYF